MPDIVTLNTDRLPTKSIPLTFCTVSLYDGWCWTQFADGSGYGAYPHDTPEYRNLAQRLGYSDIMIYCWEHEFCHSFVSEQISGQPSTILWALAHKRRHPDSTVYEEALTQAFQGFLRGGVPMTATAPDIDWEAIRDRALWLLTTAADPLRDPVGVENAR